MKRKSLNYLTGMFAGDPQVTQNRPEYLKQNTR